MDGPHGYFEDSYMNIATQLCGLALLGVLIFFYLRQQKVDFKSSRLFAVALFADVLCLSLDIYSIWAIINAGRAISAFHTAVVCKLYLMSLVFIAYVGFTYVVSQMPVTDKGGRRIEIAAFIMYVVAVVFIAAFPISYKTNGTTTYSYGRSCQVAYFFAPFFMMMTYLIALFYRKKLMVNVFATISFWIGFECFCTLVQFLNPNVLLVGFASAIGLSVVYLELENPELQIDRSSNLFNLSTLQLYLTDFYKKDLQFSYIIVKLVYDLASPPDRNGDVMRKTAEALKGIKQTKIFYIGQSCFMLVFRDSERAEEEAKVINEAITVQCHDNGNSFLEILETNGRRARSITEIMELIGQISVNGEYYDTGIYKVSDKTYDHFRQERQIVKEIDDALAEDRVEAFFQPIYSLQEDTFSGAEALVRIRRKDGSIISPGLFIPVAEKTGQVTKIGDRMFEKTLDIIKNGGVRELGVRFIDINLSVLQCEDSTLSQRYLSAMDEAGVPPQMFCFEITETAMIVNRDMLLYNLNAFRSEGCSCSLDDFGNGESNLNYVIDMPIDFIKADRSMVTKYTISSRVGLIMDSMIHMAKGLSLKVVAEGVETDEDMDAMRKLEIDYIQGFYFSKPLPRDEFIRFLQKNKKSA